MKKWIPIALGVATVLVALSGCNLFSRDFNLSEGDFPDPNTGSLLMILDGSQIPTKTIAPANMTVACYDLYFEHAVYDDHFEVYDHTGAAFSRNGLRTGGWTVRAIAKDTVGGTASSYIGEIDGVIAQTEPFTIDAGLVTDPPVQLSILPIAGPGLNLSLTLSWPLAAVNGTVSITAYLFPPGTPAPYTGYGVTFESQTSADPERGQAGYSITGKAAGYYTLLIQMTDQGSLAWGWAESIRVVYNRNTTGLISLAAGTGGLEVVIIEDMQNPIPMSWAATPATGVTQGTNITLDAEPDAVDAPIDHTYSYQWYLDGTSLGAGYTSDTITYSTSALAVGDHALCVVLTETVSAVVRTVNSIGHTFTVVAP